MDKKRSRPTGSDLIVPVKLCAAQLRSLARFRSRYEPLMSIAEAIRCALDIGLETQSQEVHDRKSWRRFTLDGSRKGSSFAVDEDRVSGAGAAPEQSAYFRPRHGRRRLTPQEVAAAADRASTRIK
jgi:hypothetical protein